MQGTATPNDPSFGVEWWANNTGQAIATQESEEVLGAPLAGTPGADDGALKAWSLTTGSRSIVIGETDTGVEYTHPTWRRTYGPTPVASAAARRGRTVTTCWPSNCNPMDEDTTFGGHGTHVAGIMGAVGNNGEGVAGMNWQTSILPVKWMQNASAAKQAR